MESIKKLLGFGTIGGLDDLAVRAFKVAVSTFFGMAGAEALGWVHNTSTTKEAIIAGAAAGANVIINAVVKWASS